MNHNGMSPMLGQASSDDRHVPALHLNQAIFADQDNTALVSMNLEDPNDYLVPYMPPASILDDSLESKVPIIEWIEPDFPIFNQCPSRSITNDNKMLRILESETSPSNKYEFKILRNNTRSITHELVDNFLYAMPKKSVPIEVLGAKAGDLVTVTMRYTTGAYHNKPVHACLVHNDINDPNFAFYIPKMNVEKLQDPEQHLSANMVVPHTIPEQSNFNFEIVFRCLNSCHPDFGKDQEMILQLHDLDGHVLKETHFGLRVCKNVNRDKRAKRSSANDTEGPPARRVKQEKIEVGEEARERGTAGQNFSPYQNVVVQIELNPKWLPTLSEFIKAIKGQMLVEKSDSLVLDPLLEA